MARLAERHPTAAPRDLRARRSGRRARDAGARRKASAIACTCSVFAPTSPAVLAAADLFALPSLSEGLPLALLEAMFAGRPIVASDVGEVRAALGRTTPACSSPPGDPPALASALDAPAGAARARARRWATARACGHVAVYDVSHMVRAYSAIYEDLLLALVLSILIERATWRLP